MEHREEIGDPFHIIRCAWELGIWAVQDVLIAVDDAMYEWGDE